MAEIIPAILISAGVDHSGGANDNGGGGGDDDDDDNGWWWMVVAYIHSRRLMIIAFLAFQPQRRRNSDVTSHSFSSIERKRALKAATAPAQAAKRYLHLAAPSSPVQPPNLPRSWQLPA